ncbi:DELTA-stichotoxin-Hcr4a-like [Notolabrus celidotus]|uniref:DELTA-stichotoxin-Hcr4a-like n=1 Tax=Notolabrus celidotus TaxID=1203425 RepID=UPI0014907707|nr:DELTA-stichotoxin-Hcr4a-like [Notolabrus celidotus]
MSESAEALAANLSSRRNVTIEITNYTSNYALLDPKIYMDSGHCHVPPGPTIGPMKTEICNFSKTSAKTSGAVGVLTYEVVQIQTKKPVLLFVLMFSVPYDQNMYKNWHGSGVFGLETEIDEKLFKKMYYDKEPQGFVRAEANGSGITFEHACLDIMSTMSPLGRSIMKVEIWEKLFHPPMTQSPY